MFFSHCAILSLRCFVECQLWPWYFVIVIFLQRSNVSPAVLSRAVLSCTVQSRSPSDYIKHRQKHNAVVWSQWIEQFRPPSLLALRWNVCVCVCTSFHASERACVRNCACPGPANGGVTHATPVQHVYSLIAPRMEHAECEKVQRHETILIWHKHSLDSFTVISFQNVPFKIQPRLSQIQRRLYIWNEFEITSQC